MARRSPSTSRSTLSVPRLPDPGRDRELDRPGRGRGHPHPRVHRGRDRGPQAGTQILASQLALPEGTTLVVDAETLVINVTQAQSAEDLEAELAEAEAEVGIVHEPSDDDLAEAQVEAAAEDADREGGDAPAAEGGDERVILDRPGALIKALLGRLIGRNFGEDTMTPLTDVWLVVGLGDPVFDPSSQRQEWQKANEMLAELNEAYSVLRNPIRRSEYDVEMGYRKTSVPPPKETTKTQENQRQTEHQQKEASTNLLSLPQKLTKKNPRMLEGNEVPLICDLVVCLQK